jgi:deoxyribose-phosphate aldolase
VSGPQIDLDALAARIARELSRADARAEASGKREERSEIRGFGIPGGPPQAAPAGVRFVRDGARIAEFIDHTLLKAEATRSEIEKLCTEALDNEFAAVCVNPVWVPLCASRLKGSRVALATVIGFPLGANASDIKAAETALAVRQGATEIDMVAAIGHIKSGDWAHVADDISAVVRAASGTLVKVIIESAHLTPVEIIKASAIAKESGAHYVKTSTGFHAAGGASAEAVALMRLVVGDALGVKASGGVRDCATALRMIANGATRIGTSSGVAMTECLGRGPLPMRELLASPHAHGSHCTSGLCAPNDAKAGGATPY